MRIPSLCCFRSKPTSQETEPQASLDIPSFLAKHPLPSGRAFTPADWAWVKLTNGERGHYEAKSASTLEKKIMLFFNQLFNPNADAYESLRALESYSKDERSIDNTHYVLKTALSVLEEMFPIEIERTAITQSIIHKFSEALGDFKPTQFRYIPYRMGFCDLMRAASIPLLSLFTAILAALALQSLQTRGNLLNPSNVPKSNILPGVAPPQLAASITGSDNVKKTLGDRLLSLSIRAFDSCKDEHDLAAVLFPPYRESLPPDWEIFVKQIPDTLTEMEKSYQALEAISPAFYEKLLQYIGILTPTEIPKKIEASMLGNFSLWETDPLAAMREVLKTSPLFAKAADLAGHP